MRRERDGWEYVLIDDPRWAPLEKFVLDPIHLDDWMWMEAWVRNGKRIEVYKHYQTRLTIHLHPNGRPIGERTLDSWSKKFHYLEIREIGRGSSHAT